MESGHCFTGIQSAWNEPPRCTRRTDQRAAYERYVPTWLPPRRFVAPIIVIGSMQLLAAMDGPIAVFALPKIQNDLGLSDAGRSWVITAYVLTFGGLMLLGGRLGDTFGRKRTFIAAVAAVHDHLGHVRHCLGWGALVVARLLQGAAAAIIAPTCVALVATTFPKGPVRNAAAAVLGAMSGVGAVVGLMVGGVLTEVSWRLAFSANVPIGLLVIYLARTTLRETQKERMRLDAIRAVLATLICTAAVFGLSMGPERGWLAATTIGPAVVALAALLAFAVVERTAENPIVPFSLFFDRNRLATFAAMFLAGGVGFTLVVLVALYVQNHHGLRHAARWRQLHPVRHRDGHRSGRGVAAGVTVPAADGGDRRLSPAAVRDAVRLDAQPRRPLLSESDAAHRRRRYRDRHDQRPACPIDDRQRRLRPDRAHIGDRSDADELGGGPLVLVAIQAVITSRTLSLAGTGGPVKFMNAAQLDALDHGVHLRFAVASRGGRRARRGGAANRLHRAAGGAGAGSRRSRRRRGTVARRHPLLPRSVRQLTGRDPCLRTQHQQLWATCERCTRPILIRAPTVVGTLIGDVANSLNRGCRSPQSATWYSER